MAGLAVFPHHGGMDDAARETIRNGWRAATGPAVLVSTIATGGTGFTLNEATISIFASSTFEYDKRLQAERRNLRIGQGKRVVYYDLIANGSLDRHVLRNLLRKQDLAKMLTSSPADTLHDLLTSDAEVAP